MAQFSLLRSQPASWKTSAQKYMSLSQGEKSQLTYVWIDGTGEGIRTKTRTVNEEPKDLHDCPLWSYCGYGCYMADSAKDSEFVIHPVAMYKDPFHGGRNKLILCDTYEYNKFNHLKPTKSNKRYQCKKLLDTVRDQHPWFGIEQEYMMFDMDGQPLGWPKGGYPAPMGPYYCSVGAGLAFGRDIVDSHNRCMLYADLNACGTNGEAVPAQWEYQIGPTEGIDVCDQMWISRYMLHRVAEDFGVIISFDPKPIAGNWNGAGAHCNFSTKTMREENGLEAIEEAIKKLSKRHEEHLKVYDPKNGEDNKRRLTGNNETATINEFSWAIGDRTVSVRIPREVAMKKKGYLEDRRPAANADPYSVVGALVKTTCIKIEDDD